MTGISPPPISSCARPAAPCSTGMASAPLYAGEVIRHGALVAGSGELLAVLAGVIAGLDG